MTAPSTTTTSGQPDILLAGSGPGADFVALSPEHDLAASTLYNEDLAPTTAAQRTWTMGSIAALWISMSACIPTYTLASSLITGGMSWSQAIGTIFLGNLIVLVPMILNAHAGTRYGIPFPVYCRAAFGTVGANVPAILRALVACGWFGIQTWIGGEAIAKILGVFVPAVAHAPVISGLGITAPELLCFLLFWSVNMWVIYKGIESIRLLLRIKAPLLIALGLLLLGWAYNAAGGWGPMLSAPSAFDAGQPKAGQFWGFFAPALTGVIGFWATLSLNIPDFSRYARSQRDQIIGQSLGLPLTMALYSFIGVAVTSATTVLYGKPIWDPVDVLTRFRNPVILIVAMIALCVATLATNIAANVVSPANDFAHLAPKRITFRIGGLLTGVLGILIMPWKLLADPSGYIFTWLGGTSALLGAIAGVLICDYWVVRKARLDLPALFDASGIYAYTSGINPRGIYAYTSGINPRGIYAYTSGINPRALAALVLAIAPCVLGFVHQVVKSTAPATPGIWDTIYTYAWFVTFALGFGVYYLLNVAKGKTQG